jgi:hypothetical protein
MKNGLAPMRTEQDFGSPHRLSGNKSVAEAFRVLFLKNAENVFPERISARLIGIRPCLNPLKNTSHNLYYVRFAVSHQILDSDT